MITVLSLVLGLLSCGVTFALYKRRKWAPRLMVMVQVPFAVYDAATHQFGFILISVGTILTGVIAHHERHDIDPRLGAAGAWPTAWIARATASCCTGFS